MKNTITKIVISVITITALVVAIKVWDCTEITGLVAAFIVAVENAIIDAVIDD